MVGPGGLNGTCGKLYPARMRTSGLGWAIGVGRIGSVVAPMLGCYLLSIGLPPIQISSSAPVSSRWSPRRRPPCLRCEGTGRRSPRLGTAITGMRHEPSPKLDDCEGSTAVVGRDPPDVRNWHPSDEPVGTEDFRCLAFTRRA